ncbi:hypothetical protein Tco_0090531 [Tanacetum coccineum]
MVNDSSLSSQNSSHTGHSNRNFIPLVMWVFDDESEVPEATPQSLGQAPPSPDYISGPEHPPSPNYVPGPEYPEYVAPSDDEVPIEDQPLLADASPITLSPGYVANSDPSEEDPQEDLEEDPVEYPADGGDDDDDDKEGEEGEEEDDEEDEEEEHLALADPTTLPVGDPVPSAEDTKAFVTDEAAPTPPIPSPRLCRARISIRPHTPPSPSAEALIAEYVGAPTPPLPPPSPLSP